MACELCSWISLTAVSALKVCGGSKGAEWVERAYVRESSASGNLYPGSI